MQVLRLLSKVSQETTQTLRLILYKFLLPLLLLIPPAHAESIAPKAEAVDKPVQTVVINTPDTLRQFSIEEAAKENIPASGGIHIIAKESCWNPNAVGDGGLANNLAQFHKTTFDGMKAQAIKSGKPFEQLSYDNPRDQITLMMWALAHGLGYNWTTYTGLISSDFTC